MTQTASDPGPVCSIAELPEDEGLRVPGTEADGHDVAIFRVGDEVFAIDDQCTHAEASLADGWLDGYSVECPLHLAKFDVRTGAVLTAPATQPVRCWRVRLVGAEVYLDGPLPSVGE